MNLYVTADRVGQANHGAGSVTFNESEALKELGPCEVWGRDELEKMPHTGGKTDPFHWQYKAIWHPTVEHPTNTKLAHIYAGCFSEFVKSLQGLGTKVTYTAAAHSIEVSRREHEKLGVPYNYPHLTDPALWERYLAGYKAADVLICPSTHSRNVMRSFGCTNHIEVIPHGVTLPPEDKVKPLPKQFRVGYLGNCAAPDKGLIYLLQAWKKLDYKDAVLAIAGHDSTSEWVQHLARTYGGGNIHFMGWVNDVADFYNSLSLYVQPSATEGFGCEVLEAMAFGRPVVCSIGVGAADVLRPLEDHLLSAKPVAHACDSEDLAELIDHFRSRDDLDKIGRQNRERAAEFTWDKIRQRYKALWKELLG